MKNNKNSKFPLHFKIYLILVLIIDTIQLLRKFFLSTEIEIQQK